MLADRVRAMHRVCFDREPSEADLAALGSRERWLVYRQLVRERLVRVVGAALRRTQVALGEARFGATLDDWLASGGPTTRYFRDVPTELVEFARTEWRERAAWIADLADYEGAVWDVRYAPRDPRQVGEFAFDRVAVLSPALRVLRLSHAVHEVPTPATGYPPKPTIVCIYRDRNHKPVPWSLNPLAATLVEAWARGEKTVTETVHEATAAHGAEIGPVFVEKLSGMIADFLERGILLGAADPAQ